MISTLFILTSVTCLFTGIYVLAMGDWAKFTLKFAAVALSTVCSIWLLIMVLLQHGLPSCSFDAIYCLQWEIYSVARNMAFIALNVTVGRDAIRFKSCDRRKRSASSVYMCDLQGGKHDRRSESS